MYEGDKKNVKKTFEIFCCFFRGSYLFPWLWQTFASSVSSSPIDSLFDPGW